jgi:hypothetical protein
VVTFADGSTKVYEYPRMAKLPIPQKFVKERYRKFFERVRLDEKPFLWPSFAQRIAHLCDNPANPPIEVGLRRWWRDISPPGKVQPEPYQGFLFYLHHVDANRLKQDRGASSE